MARNFPKPEDLDPENLPEGVSAESVQRLNKDIINAARVLGPREARYLVDTYYSIQNQRIRSMHQFRTLLENEEPNGMLTWGMDQYGVFEQQIKRGLTKWVEGQQLGEWLMSITGIGPVIAAGLLAHTNFDHLSTAGKLWAFAGLNPDQKWEKGELRPWNAKLKVLCWKAGQSFVKVHNNPKDYYGKVYATRKEYETAKNLAGDYADQAAATLAAKKIGKDTEAYAAYSVGLLPKARIQARAERYAVKLFLAHFHEVGFFLKYETMPPKPYILTQGIPNHTEWIMAPNADIIPGLNEAQNEARKAHYRNLHS